jgi:hypothetical protein
MQASPASLSLPHLCAALAAPLCAALGLLAAALPARAGEPQRAAAARTPVLLELFTSEGCSSCPPADALLAQLLETQPVDGVQVIALSEHVDYWNRLGWRDPFSDALFSARQEAYAPLAAGRIYTPQVVIDGAFAIPGNDARSLRSAVAAAASRPRGKVALQQRSQSGAARQSVTFSAQAEALPQDGALWVALVEDGLSVRVTAGENEGRTLPHTAVVRALRRVADSSGGRVQGEVKLQLDSAWRADRLRVVAFVQRPGEAVQAVGEAKVAL